jgi:hypothetical protein
MRSGTAISIPDIATCLMSVRTAIVYEALISHKGRASK